MIPILPAVAKIVAGGIITTGKSLIPVILAKVLLQAAKKDNDEKSNKK